ncbi:MAG: signal peptidase I [Prolixibacteraceae bacterium]
MFKNVSKGQLIQFGIVSGLYLLWVIWLSNFWWLLGLVIIFDMYITDKVHWTFWKKKNPPLGRQTKVVEWVDAIIFAVIAATFIRMFFIEAYTIPTSSMEKSMMVGDYLFVSKTAYGPKLPNTPVAFPFVHHTMPFTAATPSFSEIIHNKYKRLAGFGRIKNDDVVVFNFPEGDTVATNVQERSYYDLVRSFGRQRVITDKRSFGDIIYRPVDKRENYIKRCIAIPGDSLKLINGQVYINGKAQKEIPGLQAKYLVTIQGTSLNSSAMEKLDISPDDIQGSGSKMEILLTNENVKKMDAMKFILAKEKITVPKEEREANIFPSDPQYTWNLDNFGPIWIPKKGVTIQLTTKNLPLYRRIIDVYEENDLNVKDGVIYINGQVAKEYTFKMDYFWMMGDNRYNSADSRYWGFVPEDHVVGKASFVWLSLDKNKTFLGKIRWNRFFMGVK